MKSFFMRRDNRRSGRRIVAGAAFCIACMLGQSALAEKNPTLNETFTLRVGAVFLDGDTEFGSQRKGGGSNDEIDLDSLGIDGDDSTVYVGGRWRFTENWRLNLEYYGSEQSGSGVASTDLEFEDVTIPVGVTASADFQVDLYSVGVERALIRDETMELALGIGVHVADISASLSGAGLIGDTPVPFAKASTDALAPLPNFRLYGAYAFNPQLAVTGGLGYFSLTYDEYDGELTTGSVMLEWRPTKSFGIGGGYTFFDTSLEVDNDKYKDTYDFELNGPVVYAVMGF